MAARSKEDRSDRLEQAGRLIAEDQLSLQKLIAELATETRRGFDRVAQQFEETDRQMRQKFDETDQRMRQTDEGMRQTDERIDKLVIAIGELIRRPSAPLA